MASPPRLKQDKPQGFVGSTPTRLRFGADEEWLLHLVSKTSGPKGSVDSTSTCSAYGTVDQLVGVTSLRNLAVWVRIPPVLLYGRVAKQVYALDLRSSSERIGGSIPSTATML